jgi:hypothetical protein
MVENKSNQGGKGQGNQGQGLGKGGGRGLGQGLRDGRGRGRGQGRKQGPRDGSGPNPNCPKRFSIIDSDFLEMRLDSVDTDNLDSKHYLTCVSDVYQRVLKYFKGNKPELAYSV